MRKIQIINEIDKRNGTNLQELLKKKLSNFDTRVVDDNVFDLLKSENEYIKSSLNSLVKVHGNELFAIVGTITPYCANGYFYTSPWNPVYKTLDDFFNHKKPNLVNYKKPLQKDKIELFLEEHRFLFVDVIKEAYIPKESSEDNDILFYSLHYDKFKELKHIHKFICTSSNTEKCLIKILDKVGIKEYKTYVCPQNHYQYEYSVWEAALKEVSKE